jgi:sec-independent protein translocase protein TatA
LIEASSLREVNMIGLTEVLVIGGLLVLLFGASQIPKIARSMGEGLKEFKKSVKEAKEMDEEEEKKEEENKKKT